MMEVKRFKLYNGVRIIFKEVAGRTAKSEFKKP